MSAVLEHDHIPTAGDAGTALSLCTFRLGDLRLGVDVTKVQEVIRRQEATRVPLASPVIHGLMNLRGEIVTTIDLRYRLGLGTFAAGATPMNLVIRTADGPVSLLVDEIDDVADVGDTPFEPPPPTLGGVRGELITGVYKLEHALLLVLDLDRVLDTDDLSAPDELGSTTTSPHTTSQESHEATP